MCFIVPILHAHDLSAQLYSYSVFVALDGNHPTIGCEYITKDYDDYEEQIRGCNKLLSSPLREGDTVCYDQIIYDDHRVEETEYMNIRLYIKESEQATVTDTMYADISIEDDDCKFYKSCI